MKDKDKIVPITYQFVLSDFIYDFYLLQQINKLDIVSQITPKTRIYCIDDCIIAED